jgi:hypothetical protein
MREPGALGARLFPLGVVAMYQLVVIISEKDAGYVASMRLSEVLPAGGVAPLAARGPLPVKPKSSLFGDPLIGLWQAVEHLAQTEIENYT